MFKAARVESLRDKFRSVCVCGEPPKQTIRCPKCERVFGAWNGKNGVPLREFDAGGGTKVRFTVEELDNAKTEKEYDAMNVEKVVSFRQVASRYILSSPTWLLPDSDVSTTLRAYRLIVEALASDGRVMLTRFTNRGTTRRLAIVADPDRNVLVSYEVEDARETPSVPKDVVDTALLAQAKGLLAGLASDDPTFEADPDPLEALVAARLPSIEAALRGEGGEGEQVSA